jgi:acyl-CoA synthetase (AMP-forming)/AMP-acid ligase II
MREVVLPSTKVDRRGRLFPMGRHQSVLELPSRRIIVRFKLWTFVSASVSRLGQNLFGAGSDRRTEEIEAILSLHPAVRECVVIRRRDQSKDVFAFITLRGKLAGREQDLQNWVRPRIDLIEPLGRIVVLDRLPKKLTGKVDRAALNDLVVSLETGIETVW